jgi:hypothetical protein
MFLSTYEQTKYDKILEIHMGWFLYDLLILVSLTVGIFAALVK